MLDSLNPTLKKVLILIGCFLYVVSPLDLLPDFIPVLGQVDDLGVLAFAVKTLFTSPVPRALPPPELPIV